MKYLSLSPFALSLFTLALPMYVDAQGTNSSRARDLRFSSDGTKLLVAAELNAAPTDENLIAPVGSDRRLRVYSPATGKQTWVLPTKPITRGPVCLMPNFKTALTSWGAWEIKTLDIHTYKITKIFAPRMYYIDDIELSPDEKTLLVGGPNGFSLFDARTRRKLNDYRHGGFNSHVHFGPMGKTVLATFGMGGKRQVVDVATAKQVHGDGKLMVRAIGKRVELWRTPLPKNGIKLREWDTKFTRVSKIAFSPDNRTLAVGGYSNDRVPVQFLRVK